MPTSDVVVIGAGVFGGWTALLARRAGMSVTLVDAYGIGHPRATSGDESRINRSAHGGDVMYTTWARRSRETWLELGQEAGERFHVQAGVLWFADRDDGFVGASIAAFDEVGVPYDRILPDELTERWPQIDPDGVSWALFEPDGGFLMARRAVMALGRLFARDGGRFELASMWPGASSGRRLEDVMTTHGQRIAGGQFVFACGPWLPRLFPELLGSLIKVTKQDVLFFGPPGGNGQFAAEWFPVWIDYDASYYGIPGADGRAPKVASDRYGPVFDPSAGERVVDPDSIRLARRYIARRFPALAEAPVVESRVCQYETTPDTVFVIDRHPDFDNVWLVGGGSGHGFKHGPMVGTTVLSRLQGGPPGPGEERFGLAHTREPASGLRTGGDSIVRDFRGYG